MWGIKVISVSSTWSVGSPVSECEEDSENRKECEESRL